MAQKRKTQSIDITWRVALYIRLSREDGNDESMSVSNQKKILVQYVEQHFKEDFIISDMYIDDGNTGTDTDRPGFLQMKQDIIDGKVNCVMVKALSRAFRNIGDQSKFLDEFLPYYSARFISMSSPFVDTYNKGGLTGLEIPIYGIFNEQYAAATSEEVRKTFNAKRRNGEFIGAFAPHGYKKSPENKNKLLIDEEAAVIIREIFDLYLNESFSIAEIARQLNNRGIPSPAMYKRMKGMKFQNPNIGYKDVFWTPVGVSGILKNQMYIGDMVQGRQRIISYKIHKAIKVPEKDWFIAEGTHEAIINKDVFYAVKKLLTKETRVSGNNKAIHLFSGFVRCKDCGRSLHRKTSKGNVYYFCRISKEAPNVCTRHSIRESKLEEAVLTAIRLQVNLIENIKKLITKVKVSPKTESKSIRLQSILNQHENELAKITMFSDSLYADLKSNVITLEEYKRLKLDYARRQNDLNAAIEKVKENISEIVKFTENILEENPYFDYIIKHKNIKNLTRDVLSSLIDEIFIHENGEITINFNFADQYQRITEFLIINKQFITT